jgi:hypothetical protein
MEEISATMSLITIDLLDCMSICKRYSDLTSQDILNIMNINNDISSIQKHIEANNLNMEFLEKLILSYTSKIDDKILSEKKRLYGPAHVAMAVCKRISDNNQYLDNCYISWVDI